MQALTGQALCGLALAVLCIASGVQELDAGEPVQLAPVAKTSYNSLLSSAEDQAAQIGQSTQWAVREASAAAKLMGVHVPQQAEVIPLDATPSPAPVQGPPVQDKAPYTEVKQKIQAGEIKAKHRFYNENRPLAPTPPPIDGETTAGGAQVNGPTPPPAVVTKELGQDNAIQSNQMKPAPKDVSSARTELQKAEAKIKDASDREIQNARMQRAGEEKALKAGYKIIVAKRAKKTEALRKLERTRLENAAAKAKRNKAEKAEAAAETAALRKELAKIRIPQQAAMDKIKEQNAQVAKEHRDVAARSAARKAKRDAITRSALEKDLFALKEKARVMAAKPRALTPEEKAKEELASRMKAMGMHSKILEKAFNVKP